MEKDRIVAASDLLNRLQSLIDRFSNLANDVQDKIEAPMKMGDLPDLALIGGIQEAHDSARVLFSEARESGMFDRDYTNLKEMLERLERIIDVDIPAALQADYRVDAERALRISYRDEQSPPFLENIHTRARQFLEELAGLSASIAASAEEWGSRAKPFRDLWTLLSEPDSLTEMQAEEILKTLEKEFGLSLILAITLKRLVVKAVDPSPGQTTEIIETMRKDEEPASGETVLRSDCDQTPIETEAPDREKTIFQASNDSDLGDKENGDKGEEVKGEQQSVAALPETEAPSSRGLDPRRRSEISDTIWRLVSANRAGLAYHLALCAESLDPLCAIQPSSALLRAVVLGPAVRSSSGEIVEQYRKCVEELTSAWHEWQEGGSLSLPAKLLIFGSALRPTLLAPGSGAFSLLEYLKHLDSLSEALGQIRRGIYDFGSNNLELSAGVLKGVRDQAVWQEQLKALSEEARCWLDHNRQAKIIYAPTTDVWHKWLDRTESIGQVLEIIINLKVDRDHSDLVLQAIKKWSDPADVVRYLGATDERIRGGAARRLPIQARARTVICSRVQEFVQMAQRWIDTINDEPRALDDFRQQRADKCREVVQRHLHSALEDVSSLATATRDSSALASAVKYLHSALEEVGNLFDASRQESTRSVPVRILLGEELLALPDLPLSEEWQPKDADPLWLLQRLEDASVESYDPDKAFRRQSEAGNHLATERVIEGLEARSDDRHLIDRLAKEREVAVQQCRHALNRKLEGTRQLIEQAVCYDLITDEERARFLGSVEDCRLLIEDVRDFALERRKLEEIDIAMQERRQQRISEVRRKFTDTIVSTDRQNDMELIRQAIERDDFLSANEYIELVRNGQPLIHVSESTRNIFGEFFPTFVQELTSFIEGDGRSRPEMRDIIEAIRNQRSRGPIDMRGVPAPQAVDAAKMLDAWVRMKTGSSDVSKYLTTLLTAFGFANVKVSKLESPKNPYWLALCECTPLSDPKVCIVPHFSSQAKGRYRVLGLVGNFISEKRPDEESIVNLVREVRDLGGADPIIVLYFGRMTAQRRRDLAELCWQRRRSFLLIDETLIFFLSNERFSRLPVLFQCALPFTVAEPYTTTASLVPVEMFFGREQERRAIIDPYGTNLVYGGRQLGKSALLRDVERREHNQEQGRVVRWIDLKNKGIGIDLPADDLWAVIGQDLHDVKVLPRPATTYQTVADRIKDWLNGDANRRILLLLDEADAFLEADSRAVNEKTRHSFPEVSRLKGLMDDTDRRFKVVFAGLHNVQRVARDPNTPVGHLGTPVCIGPLLDNGEWRQARDLIDIPFRHMGYEFDPPDLWMRILSYTNYYPSLIQVYCKHLLEYLHNRDRTAFDFKQSPPYRVTAQQVEDVYQSAALQGEIRHKFELTLGLDERYRLIALCVALASIEQREDKVVADVSWVRDQALFWWPGGFASDTSYELFRTILDEMVGLGVLRRAGSDTYALRSPNVLNLLGSKSQIEQKLMDVAQLPPPPNYEAASFRRSLNADCWTRSPLTADQEASLIERANGVTVIYGSQLSGLTDIIPALSVIPSQTVYFDKSLRQLNQFTDWLREIDRKRPDAEGVTLAAVTPENLWSISWISQAGEFVRRKTSSTKRFFRVVFIADPELAWYLLEDRPRLDWNLSELSLKPWRDGAMHRWLEDADLGAEAVNNCGQILAQTGGWGMLVHAFGEMCRNEPHKWREHLADISKSWPDDPRWKNCCDLIQSVLPVLEIMAQWNSPIGVQELKDLEPNTDISRVLNWADRLSYVREVETDQWIIDPIVGLLVKQGA